MNEQMGSNEEDFLQNRKKTKVPLFDAPDGKILTFGMFRGPHMGFFSEIDLNNLAEKYDDNERLTK